MAGSNPSVQRFRKVLAAMPKPLKAATRKELSKEGRKMVAAMKGAAPSGDKGALKRSVRMQTKMSGMQITIRAGGRQTLSAQGAGRARRYDYSIGVEYGTKRIAAKPFFWPTYRARRDQVTDAIHNALRRSLKEAWNV